MIKRTAPLIAVCAAAAVFCILLAGCDLEQSGGSGHITVKMYLEGYPFSENLKSEVIIENQSRDLSFSKTADFSSDFYASAFFPNTDAGTWTVTVRYIDGESSIGDSYSYSIEAVIGQTAISTVNGRYADGVLTFTSATDTTELQTSMALNKVEAFISAKMQGSGGYVGIEKSLYAFGEFDTLDRVTVEYPDGVISSMESRGFPDSTITWISVNDNQITAGRDVNSENITELSESGSYLLTLEDENGSVLRGEDAVNITVSTEFLPQIINPIDGGTVPGIGTWNADWQFGNVPEVRSIAVVIYEQNNGDTPVFTAVIGDPQSIQSVSIPDSACTTGLGYEIIVAAFDTYMTESELNSLKRYHHNDFFRQIAEHLETEISAAALHVVSFTGS